MTDTDTSATESPVPFEQTNLGQALQKSRQRNELADLAGLPALKRVPPLIARMKQAILMLAHDDFIVDCFSLWHGAMQDLLDSEPEYLYDILYFGLYTNLNECFEANNHLVKNCPEAIKAFLRVIVNAWLKTGSDYHADFMAATLRNLAFTNEQLAKRVANALRHGGFNHARFQQMRHELERRVQRSDGKADDTSRQLVTALDFAAFSSLDASGRDFFNEIAPSLNGATSKVRAKVFAILNRDLVMRQVKDLVTRKVQDTLDGLGESHRTTTFVIFVTPSDDIYDSRVTVDLTFDAGHMYGSHQSTKEAILTVLEGEGISRSLAAMLDSVSSRATPISFIAHIDSRLI